MTSEYLQQLHAKEKQKEAHMSSLKAKVQMKKQKESDAKRLKEDAERIAR